MTVEELNRLPEAAARERLRSCCGSTGWVEAMVRRRPFGTLREVEQAAQEIWRGLGEPDWKEAFAHHPRIGESNGARDQGSRGRLWSRTEQAGVSSAPEAIKDQIRRLNREYEDRFGYIYIVSAAGLGPADLLARARDRLGNDPAVELEIAAREQLKITLLRLDRLLAKGE